MPFRRPLRTISEDLKRSIPRQPSPVSPSYTCIRIGDVGYIHEGQFRLLFSAGSPRQPRVDDPTTIQVLNVGDPVIGERPPGCLHTPSVQPIGLADHRGFTPMCVPSITLSSTAFNNVLHRSRDNEAIFTFQLTRDCGAALVSRQPTRQMDSPFGLKSEFESFIKRHFKSWLKLASVRHPNQQGIKPILVSGFDLAKDFAVVSYSNDSGNPPPAQGSGNTFYKPMFERCPPPFHGRWRYKSLPYGFDGGGISTEARQCVFIRYYTMRFRGMFTKKVPKKEVPDKIRGGAGPHDLGSGDNRGGAFPELAVRYDDEPTVSEDEDSRGRPVVDGTGSEPGNLDQNTPQVPFCSHSIVDLQDEEYDDWDAIADYVFQVILFPLSTSCCLTLSGRTPTLHLY